MFTQHSLLAPLILFLFLTNIARAINSYPATRGGAAAGMESTLSQQVHYASFAIGNLLKPYEMELIPHSVSIDSDADYDGRPFIRFNRDISGKILLLKHIPRTVSFSARHQSGDRYRGKIYLIEQLPHLYRGSEAYKRNATVKVTTQTRNGVKIIFGLSKDAYDTRFFALDIIRKDLNLTSLQDNQLTATSNELLNYITSILRPLLWGRDVGINLPSLDISPYILGGIRMQNKNYALHSITFSLTNGKSGFLYLIDKMRSYDLATNQTKQQIQDREYALSYSWQQDSYSINLDYHHLNLYLH